MPTNNAVNQMYSAKINITSAQIKSLSASPIQLVAAPGVGKFICPLAIYSKFNYGGTNAFTNGSIINPVLGNKLYTYSQLWAVSAITGTTTRFIVATGGGSSQTNAIDNLALNLAAAGAEYAGNAANDNSIDIQVYYQIFPV